MPQYNPAIQRLWMPDRIKKLPVDERGYPVPRFVQYINGKPDFRVIREEWLHKCIQKKICWLCGDPLGRHLAFPIGPMCAINRVNSEPPCHLVCAEFAVKACPFMVFPNRKRNEDDLPDNRIEAPGMPILRNPGVMCIWITNSYQTFRARGGNRGLLFSLGEAEVTSWWSQGRRATREEVMASINSGLPILQQMAEHEGPSAIAEFERQKVRGLALVPAV